MTLSNRITLAGALPILVAFALAVLVAAIALAPSRPAFAAPDAKLCDLSPVLLEMLLERQDASAQQCDTLIPATEEQLAAADFEEDTWDLSANDDRSLTEFAISDDDADKLKVFLNDNNVGANDPAIPATVKYIDLTGNPLMIDDVDFKNIPPTAAVILSADSPVAGFQDTEYTVTEGSPSYIAFALPDLTFDSNATVLAPSFTITGRDATEDFDTNEFMSGSHLQLIKFGTGAAASRPTEINSVSDNRIFYLPFTVDKDNDNSDEWDFTIEINAGITGATTGYELANDKADITVLDADAPSTSVCDRSEDVEAEILDKADDDGVDATFGAHTKCDDLTLRDLGAFTSLVIDDDDLDLEPIEDLVAGDFEGLKGLTTLHIVGARSLPSGIFAGVGSADGNSVQITFGKNTSPDDDVDQVGNLTPSTIPAHIFSDQEPQQVIILTDDTNDAGEGTTSGLDAGLYAGVEGEHIFVLTNAATTSYILGNKVDFAAFGDGQANPIQGPTIADRGAGSGEDNSKAARFAVKILPDDSEDKGERNTWLFLFDTATGTEAPANPDNAGDLKDIAVVAVTDDD